MGWDREELLRAHDEAAYVCGIEPVHGIFKDDDVLDAVASKMEAIAAASSAASALVALGATSDDATLMVNAMRPLFTLFCAIVRQELGVDECPYDASLSPSGDTEVRRLDSRQARRELVGALRKLCGVPT